MKFEYKIANQDDNPHVQVFHYSETKNDTSLTAYVTSRFVLTSSISKSKERVFE